MVNENVFLILLILHIVVSLPLFAFIIFEIIYQVTFDKRIEKYINSYEKNSYNSLTCNRVEKEQEGSTSR